MLQAIRHGELIITTILFYLQRKNKNEKLMEKDLALRHKQQARTTFLLHLIKITKHLQTMNLL
jgi:hypothetical protein